jgi:sugar O-acyltransferase (sialic acid O-acetyltransferase NeuD family)
MTRSGEPLVIVGAGGHGREVLDTVEAINAQRFRFKVLGFLDEGPFDESLLQRRGTMVLGDVTKLEELEASYLIAIGSPEARRRIDDYASSLGRQAASAVHPAATVGSDAYIGPGAVLSAGSRVTTNVRTGRHVHLNVNATVSHDCTLGDYVTLNPGANIAGNVEVEAATTLGIGAAVIQGLRIGGSTLVGAGAVVIDDLPSHVTAVGVPARAVP